MPASLDSTPRRTPHWMAVPIIAPNAASTPNALRSTSMITSGTLSALSTITSAATSR